MKNLSREEVQKLKKEADARIEKILDEFLVDTGYVLKITTETGYQETYCGKINFFKYESIAQDTIY
jgi:hypothetical protein